MISGLQPASESNIVHAHSTNALCKFDRSYHELNPGAGGGFSTGGGGGGGKHLTPFSKFGVTALL